MSSAKVTHLSDVMSRCCKKSENFNDNVVCCNLCYFTLAESVIALLYPVKETPEPTTFAIRQEANPLQ